MVQRLLASVLRGEITFFDNAVSKQPTVVCTSCASLRKYTVLRQEFDLPDLYAHCRRLVAGAVV